ncbi:chromosome partitioning protein ParB (plasmid) [Acinetobacter johnsonii]|uniref:Chromosome partitioning protein ParB n=1 Tax=Acinetobacter johnsonii TaxID=40214 RepID=A0A3S9AQH8_ACIJO|nr:chromosome partitioning protein ParB [Acinetobacter johnsonii]AZN65844.1 chromosome partitioning protein ParB [Acinetobacter johnsonii]WNL65754.1 plasmid partition protein ParB-like [Klebsiella oxytoca]
MSKSISTLSAGRPSVRNDKAKAATLASLADDAGGMKRVNFELSPALHSKLKIYAAKQGMSIKELLTHYVDSLPE